MFGRNGKSQYNQQMLNRAITSATLRIIVAGYIIFIAINLINGTKSEDSSIPAWAGTLIGFVFIALAAGFIIYSIRSFFKARDKARLDADENGDVPEEKPKEKPKKLPDPEAGMSIAEKVRAAQAMIDPKAGNKPDQ